MGDERREEREPKLMTTEEIRELIAGVGVKIASLAELHDRTEEELRQNDRQLKESLQETHRELKESMQETRRELKESMQETRRELKESLQESRRNLDESLERTHLEMKESSQKVDRQLADLGRQLGGLGEKFGGFTEGLALPSMTNLLEERFHMDFVAPRARARRNGNTMEIDVLAYSNSRVNEAYLVEVKSHLRQEGLDQMKKILRQFRDFFPSHADKRVYGILAVVDAPEELRQKVLEEGIYLARIHDEEFKLEVPKDFRPRAF